MTLSSQIWNILACPQCGAPLTATADGAHCPACNLTYPATPDGQLDLRLQHAKPHAIAYQVGSPPPDEFDPVFKPLAQNPQPEVDFTTIQTPWHLTDTLLSHIPRPHSENALMLDLGCGEGIHQAVMEHAGYEWVGLDYGIPAAPIKGDAHALPFQDASFEFILSIAVLEHLQYPAVAMHEVYRTLKPGGKFIGTVSFLEPFHDNSYYHHTHLGSYNTLRQAGFLVEQVAPSADWPGLYAQAEMALFRNLPAWLGKAIMLPPYLLHRLYWRIGYMLTKNKRASENYRLLATSGAFTFIATKPA